jgi:uncharacterized membrane protein (GlpM family)
MDVSFWSKLALSFIVGSLWVTLTTVSAERFGSKIGGLLGGLPSTVVIALFFIGYSQTPIIASQATTIMPLAQGLNGLFVLSFMLLARWGLGLALTGSLAIWLLQSTILYLLHIQVFWISLLGWLLLLVICTLVYQYWRQIPSSIKLKVNYPPWQLVWRALFGGAVISLAVLMGKLGGALLGGIFSSFPAIFLTTLVITYRSGGVSFSRAVGKSLLISGLINVPLYEIVVRHLYPQVGLIAGTVLAIFFSLGTGYLTFVIIKTQIT